MYTKKKFFAYNSDNFPTISNLVQFPILCSDNNFIHQDHLRREGKEGRKKKEGRDDVLQNRQVWTCAVMKHTLIYARKPKAPTLLISPVSYLQNRLALFPNFPSVGIWASDHTFVPLTCDCKYKHDVLSTTTESRCQGSFHVRTQRHSITTVKSFALSSLHFT